MNSEKKRSEVVRSSFDSVTLRIIIETDSARQWSL